MLDYCTAGISNNKAITQSEIYRTAPIGNAIFGAINDGYLVG